MAIYTNHKAPAISLKNVYLSYQNKPLFNNLSLEIPATKCVCLLGPSGIGKTRHIALNCWFNNRNKSKHFEIFYYHFR